MKAAEIMVILILFHYGRLRCLKYFYREYVCIHLKSLFSLFLILYRTHVYYNKPRFDTEQVSDVESSLNLFGDDRQSHLTVGELLYFTAK